MKDTLCSWHIIGAQETLLFVIKMKISKPSFLGLVVVLKPAFGNQAKAGEGCMQM